MLRLLMFASAVLLVGPASAAVQPFPAGFRTQMIDTNGTKYFVRVGGTGPAVVMLHGFGDTGDMWAPIAAKLMKDHTVIVPDLRGMGLSAHPDTGYTKKNQAVDVAGVLDHLKVDKADSGGRRLGQDHLQPGAVAFQLPRAGCGAARRRARAHLSRSILERAVRQSEGNR